MKDSMNSMGIDRPLVPQIDRLLVPRIDWGLDSCGLDAGTWYRVCVYLVLSKLVDSYTKEKDSYRKTRTWISLLPEGVRSSRLAWKVLQGLL